MRSAVSNARPRIQIEICSCITFSQTKTAAAPHLVVYYSVLLRSIQHIHYANHTATNLRSALQETEDVQTFEHVAPGIP
jgi:hypothetical protein